MDNANFSPWIPRTFHLGFREIFTLDSENFLPWIPRTFHLALVSFILLVVLDTVFISMLYDNGKHCAVFFLKSCKDNFSWFLAVSYCLQGKECSLFAAQNWAKRVEETHHRYNLACILWRVWHHCLKDHIKLVLRNVTTHSSKL